MEALIILCIASIGSVPKGQMGRGCPTTLDINGFTKAGVKALLIRGNDAHSCELITGTTVSQHELLRSA